MTTNTEITTLDQNREKYIDQMTGLLSDLKKKNKKAWDEWQYYKGELRTRYYNINNYKLYIEECLDLGVIPIFLTVEDYTTYKDEVEKSSSAKDEQEPVDTNDIKVEW